MILPNSNPSGCRKSWTWPWETKLVGAVGSRARSNLSSLHISPELTRVLQRGAPCTPGPPWSPHRTLNSSGKASTYQTLSVRVAGGELLGSVCSCDLPSATTSIPFTWLCSVKIRTPKLQTRLFWTGPSSLSFDFWYSRWLFKSYFALERILHTEVEWDKILLSYP